MKNDCNIIMDLLPLYADGALSEASKELVQEHIGFCEECANALKGMQESIKLPVNKEVRLNETSFIKGLKKIVFNWKLLTGIMAGLSALLLLMLSAMYLNHKTTAVEYDGSNIAIEKRENGYYLRYNGKGEILFSAGGNRESGEWTIEFSQSLWGRYIDPLYDRDGNCRWFCEEGEITKLTTMDGTVIWEGSEEDVEAHEQWLKERSEYAGD